MDPTLRLAAERVKAWHLARFLAHVEPPEPTMPPPPAPTPEHVQPISDPPQPDTTEPGEDAMRATAPVRRGPLAS